MQQIVHYQLDETQCTYYVASGHEVLTVSAGSLWLTREGDEMDHWLVAGDTIELEAQQRFWLSAESTRVDMLIRREVPHGAAPWALAPQRSPAGFLARSGALAHQSQRAFVTWICGQFTKRRLSPRA